MQTQLNTMSQLWNTFLNLWEFKKVNGSAFLVLLQHQNVPSSKPASITQFRLWLDCLLPKTKSTKHNLWFVNTSICENIRKADVIEGF